MLINSRVFRYFKHTFTRLKIIKFENKGYKIDFIIEKNLERFVLKTQNE